MQTAPVFEQRAFQRTAVDTPVLLSLFQSGGGYSSLQATACDQSPSGICISSTEQLIRGMVVFIRALNCGLKADTSALLRSVTVADVRWCRAVQQTDERRFMLGIRYL